MVARGPRCWPCTTPSALGGILVTSGHADTIKFADGNSYITNHVDGED
jgi:hypothetical protein